MFGKRLKNGKKEISEATKKKIVEIGNILNKKDGSYDSDPTTSDEEKKLKNESSLKNSKGVLPVRSAPSTVVISRRYSDGQSIISSKGSSKSSISDSPNKLRSTESIRPIEDYIDTKFEEEEIQRELTKAEMDAATAILDIHINALEEDRKKDEIKIQEEKKKQEALELEEKEVNEIWDKTFIPIGKQLEMLKTSMRFVPGVNPRPNVHGHPDDPPYLFKTPGRIVERKRKAEYSINGIKPTTTPTTSQVINPRPGPSVDNSTTTPTPGQGKPKYPRPIFGLNWPNQGSQLVFRSHHNLLVAFLAYYNKKAEAEQMGSSGIDLYDPSLSISCALACGKSPFPPMKRKNPLSAMPIPTDSSGAYTLVPMSTIGIHDASEAGFWPHGFGPQPDGSFIPVPLEYYMPQNQPYFPDPKNFNDIPEGATVGYIDSFGHFIVPNPGDPLPPDAHIGYMDNEGIYHHYMDLSEGLQSGQIPVKQIYPYYPGSQDEDIDPYGSVPDDIHYHKHSGVHYPYPHGEFEPGMFPDGFHGPFPIPGKNYVPESEFPPGYPGHLPQQHRPHRDFISEEGYIPGDPTHHQSEAVFTGHGGQIAAQKNDWQAAEGKKKKKKKKNKYDRDTHDDGNEEGEESSHANGGEETSGSDVASDENDEGGQRQPKDGLLSTLQSSQLRKKTGPPIIYDTSILTDDWIPTDGLTKLGMVLSVAPQGSRAGYMDKDGKFIEVKDGEEFPQGVPPSYIDEKGTFHQLLLPKSHEAIPTVPTGFVDENGVFHSSNGGVDDTGAIFGYIDEDGVFHELVPGQSIPEGATPGHLDESGMFHIANKLPPGAIMGHTDEFGNFQALLPGEPMPPGGVVGYMDPDGNFHAAPTPPPPKPDVPLKDGVKRPSKKPPIYIEDTKELIEVEILDENDLDENGKPKVKVILRHRGSIAAPTTAKDIEGGGKVWIEGGEEVTEMPYFDHNDLDENGQPTVKRMRVRKRINPKQKGSRPSVRKNTGQDQTLRTQRLYQPPTDDDDINDYEDLRSQPMTADERVRLLHFQKNAAVQVELDYIEGSLDLGEVVRKSFRIYSHGGSVDIDPTALVRHISEQLANNAKSLRNITVKFNDGQLDQLNEEDQDADEDEDEDEENETSDHKHQ